MSIDPKIFRQGLGRFATGVTIVSATDQGSTFGMTVNSLTSVSLDPPLILFCAKPGHTRDAILESGHFAVNILAESQRDLALRFAGIHPVPEQDRFQGLAFDAAPVSGAPWLSDCLGWLDCRIQQTIPGGDHLILLAEVVDLKLAPVSSPLLFFAGQWPVVQPPAGWVG